MICDLEDKKGSGPAGQSCLARRGNPQFVTGDGILVRKTQIASFAWSGILVFWAGAPENAVLGAPARCVFGTWHVAVWIFGAKTRGIKGTACGGATDYAKQSQFGKSVKCKVSSVKLGKPGDESWESSYFRLYTSNSAEGRSWTTPPARLPCRCEDAMVN